MNQIDYAPYQFDYVRAYSARMTVALLAMNYM
jgi:hypothetical protein